MKSLMIAASAAAMVAAFAAPAMAADVQVYGTAGVAQSDGDSVDTTAIQARIGARINPYFGVEGEIAHGVKGDSVTVGGSEFKVKNQGEIAGYAVGYYPVTEKIDLFARVGYGNTDYKVSGLGASGIASGNSWNYGVGGQYFFTPQDGIRAEWTRKDFNDGGDANVYGVSYVRKF